MNIRSSIPVISSAEARQRLLRLGYEVSELVDRDYGQTEFFLTDDDPYSHCFGVPTRAQAS